MAWEGDPNDENLDMGGGSDNGPVDVQPGGALDYGVGGDYRGAAGGAAGSGAIPPGNKSGDTADNDRVASDKAFWDKEFDRLGIGKPGAVGGPTRPGATAEPAPAASQIKNETGKVSGSIPGGRPLPYQYIKAPTFNPVAAPVLPTYTSPKYTPPVEDPAYYRKQRAEASAPGMRALRTQAADQNLASRNMENPNARAVANRGAMQGYGQGVSSVQSGAAQTARAQADRKRTEDLTLFNAKYNILSKDHIMEYNNQLQTIMENFKQSLQKRDVDYQRDSALWAQQPLNVKIDPRRYGAR